MFDGFTETDIETRGAVIRTLHAGSGAPLLLLHGNPFTHVSWHKIAPALAERFTVVATDLRGYGDSSKPEGGTGHENYSFRAMAEDQVEVMEALGFDAFFVAGHDRGARVGHRMALDHPKKVRRLALLDIMPTYQLLSDVSRAWAEEAWHWFFMAQPAPLPEHFLTRDLGYYIRAKLERRAGSLAPFTPEAMAEYIRCCTPENVHAVCEDYRATLGVDFDTDRADFEAGRRIVCPLLVIWGEKSPVGRHSDPAGAWSQWAKDVRFKPLPCGHYPAEESPELTLQALQDFFALDPSAFVAATRG